MGAIKNYYHDEICALPETPDPYDEQLAREQGEMNREAQEIMEEMTHWWQQMDGDADYIRENDDAYQDS